MNTTTNQIEAKRKELKALIESQAAELIRTDADLIELQQKIMQFSEDCYMKGSARTFNECGDFVSQLDLGSNFLDSYDSDLQDELIAQLTDDTCVYILNYFGNTYLETHLGDVVTINFSDRRNCYAVHSDALKLKLNYSDLIGDDDEEKEKHALYLIEVAMRKAGYFPGIATLDYYGNVVGEPSTELGNLSDEELAEYGKKFEESEEE